MLYAMGRNFFSGNVIRSCFRLGVLVSLTGLLLPGAVKAQSSDVVSAPPVRQSIDSNGINIVSGQYNLTDTDVDIGAGDNRIAMVRMYRGGGWVHSFFGTIASSGSTRTVSIGGNSEKFTLSSGVYVPDEGTPSTLTYNSSNLKYTYTNADGVIAEFDTLQLSAQYQFYAYTAVLSNDLPH